MIHALLSLYEKIFCRTIFYRVNKFLFVASAKGLGLDSSPKINAAGETAVLSTFIKRNTSANPVIFDVGANVGMYAIKLKKLITDARVFAFEPHPATFKSLEQASRSNGFSAINKGCGSQVGTLNFYDYSGLSEGSEHATLLPGVIEQIHQGTAQTLQVEVTTIDAFMEAEKLERIDLLKIDTEGYEYEVLKGCRQALAEGKIRMIYFEFNSMNILSRVYMNDFIQLLKGFTFYRSVADGLIPIEHSQRLLSELFVFQNVLAVKA
jgi:FkbM family methyltransferase